MVGGSKSPCSPDSAGEIGKPEDEECRDQYAEEDRLHCQTAVSLRPQHTPPASNTDGIANPVICGFLSISRLDEAERRCPCAGPGSLLQKSELLGPCGPTGVAPTLQRGFEPRSCGRGPLVGDKDWRGPVMTASFGSLIRSMLVGGGWKVTVSPVDSAEVLAERRVGRRRTAERLRSAFVRVATEQRIDRTEKSRIARLLGIDRFAPDRRVRALNRGWRGVAASIRLRAVFIREARQADLDAVAELRLMFLAEHLRRRPDAAPRRSSELRPSTSSADTTRTAPAGPSWPNTRASPWRW